MFTHDPRDLVLQKHKRIWDRTAGRDKHWAAHPFLLEPRDLHCYHFGYAPPFYRPHWEALEASPPPQADPCLETALAQRAAALSRQQFTTARALQLLTALRNPATAASTWKREAAENPVLIHELRVLLNLIPQYPKTGVIAKAQAAFWSAPDIAFVDADESDDWTGASGALGYLRPLEYLFGLGGPGTRLARLHMLRHPCNLPLGTIFEFGPPSLSKEEVALCGEDLVGALCDAAGDEVRHMVKAIPLFHALTRKVHSLLPALVGGYWSGITDGPRLTETWSRQPLGSAGPVEPLRRHSTPLDSAMADVMQRALKNALAGGAGIPSPLGTISAEDVHGDLDRDNEIFPRTCVTLVSCRGDEALQVVFPINCRTLDLLALSGQLARVAGLEDDLEARVRFVPEAGLLGGITASTNPAELDAEVIVLLNRLQKADLVVSDLEPFLRFAQEIHDVICANPSKDAQQKWLLDELNKTGVMQQLGYGRRNGRGGKDTKLTKNHAALWGRLFGPYIERLRGRLLRR